MNKTRECQPKSRHRKTSLPCCLFISCWQMLLPVCCWSAVGCMFFVCLCEFGLVGWLSQPNTDANCQLCLHIHQTPRWTTHKEDDFFVESLSSGPSASHNTFSVSTIADGHARAGSRSSYLPLRRPDCTSSRSTTDQ